MNAIEEILGPRGLLAKGLAAYEDRPQQLRMAHAVAEALEGRHYLLAEAGTGTGKTLAYLVPALLSGRKVVVSTATKTLQDQIFYKDLPLLAREAGIRFRAAYMKGRANYLCWSRFERFDEEPALVSREEARLYPRVSAWARSTQTGDRAELDLPEAFAAWRELSTTSETCIGQRCADYDRCFVTKMRRDAAEADVVVVNHHLFFADLTIRSAAGGAGEVIPRYDAVVFDEAHALEEVASAHFGVQVSSYRLDELTRDGRKADEAAAEAGDAAESQLEEEWTELEAASEALFTGMRALVPENEATRFDPRLGKSVEPQRRRLGAVLEKIGQQLDGSEVAERTSLSRRAQDIQSDLLFLFRAAEPGFVFHAERRNRGTFLRATPVDVGRELVQRLYANVDTAILTSATLSAGGSFNFLEQRLGLRDAEGNAVVDVREVSVPAPFNYQEQAILYLPRHLPDPQEAVFATAAAGEIEKLCELVGGRAFVLCTSLRQMQELHRQLRDRLPYQVLLQGEMPKLRLLERFRERSSVLFASHSFWEGVDVPGDALSLVIIDKLPFANPRDPLVSARIDLLKSREIEPFDAYQVPSAALALRQGVGRLIRTRTDRGIIAILDRRIVTRSYGKTILDSLPPARRASQFAEVVKAWAELSVPLPPVSQVRQEGMGSR